MNLRHALLAAVAFLPTALPLPASAIQTALPAATAQPTAKADGSFTIATYNVENWHTHFSANKYKSTTLLPNAEADAELKRALRSANDEDNWEISQVILDPAFAPDVLMCEEAAEQSDLDYFNKRWLNSAYATVHVFPTNTTRSQTLAMFLKPGFKALEIRENYHNEPDPSASAAPATGEDAPKEGEAPKGPPKLFARGPAFVLLETPSGSQLWVGVTHGKSKSGNSVAVTQWRNREAERTHAIMKELHGSGKPVLLVGDFNDELGEQDFDAEAGGSSVEKAIGPASDGFFCVTQPLAESKSISFHGYTNPRYRSFIDHIVASDDLKPAISNVHVFENAWTKVASDHFPVTAKVTLPIAPATKPN